MHIALTRIGITLAVAMVAMPATARGATAEPPMALAVTAAARAVCRPTLRVDANSYEAGTAFLLAGAQPLLLTAQHLFGPEGGLAMPVAWQDMPAHAQIVSCTPVGGTAPLSGGKAIAIAGAQAMDPAGQVNDVAVFRASAGADGTAGLTVAALPPKRGDRVWLIAEVQGSNSPLHPAHILGEQNGALLFAYDDPKLDLRATSGAPIVGTDGKVVGLNLGGGYDSEAKTVIGVADGLAVLTRAVAIAGH